VLTTRFTRLIGCNVPIQQAGMGGVATAELASAVALAGALGMIGGVRLGAKVLGEELDSLLRQTRLVGVALESGQELAAVSLPKPCGLVP
jgi:nitronate monooxygenase